MESAKAIVKSHKEVLRPLQVEKATCRMKNDTGDSPQFVQYQVVACGMDV